MSSYTQGLDRDITECLEQETAKYMKMGNVLLCGDFNARIANSPDYILNDDQSYLPLFDNYPIDKQILKRQSSDTTIDSRGKSLLDLCILNQLRILNGRVLGDVFGKYTCYTPNGSSVVDYVMVSESILDQILYFYVHNFMPTISDCHCILEWEMSSKFTVDDNDCNINMFDKSPNFIWSDESPTNFQTALLLPDIQTQIDTFNKSIIKESQSSVDEAAAELSHIFLSAATNSLKRNKLRNKKIKTKKWFDGDLYHLRNKLISYGKIYSKFPYDPLVRGHYYKLNKQYSKLRKFKYKEYKKSLVEQLQNLHDDNPKSYWKLINDLKNNDNKDHSSAVAPSVWVSHFNGLYQLHESFKERVAKLEKKLDNLEKNEDKSLREVCYFPETEIYPDATRIVYALSKLPVSDTTTFLFTSNFCLLIMLKAIILIGGPIKGTRFRPLSLELAKPLFPVAGFPVIYHHIEACSKVPDIKEVILIGFFQPNDALTRFINSAQMEFKIQIRYLQEYTALGTAGGLYHFRDQILAGQPDYFFVMNSDVCGDFPLKEMLQAHRKRVKGSYCTILGIEATRQQSLNYGCIVENKDTHEVLHYVEKPETYISTTINGGVYLFSPEIFQPLELIFKQNLDSKYSFDPNITTSEVIRLEQDIFVPLASSGKLFVYDTKRFWSQIKSTGAAIYANRHYLAIYQTTHKDRLATNGEGKPKIIGDVTIHPTAQIHPTAVLGPNVSIGKYANIGEGVRVRESIVLEGATLQDHSCVLYSIIGWNAVVGSWTRVEGTPNDPNPNKPFAKIEVTSIFTNDGKLNPSITVIGSNVQIPSEVVILNSIVLPDKSLSGSYKNQIIL
ncbi:mannose-1-phosphate guanylyltransferase [Mytilus galloprovincialis]|uniref:Mannose-1-phosphate guanylyltransferase n=2 Tax=Mytilus galloprovincialis TaxID=29158 RepID=A0A8B6DES1_MYTGA|nr:mannose-1-phosphate guanylyltransferase [Mytilus galloprovincialis]